MENIGLRCPNCEHLNEPTADFCAACGASLPKSCPNCGYQVPIDHKFCGNCGTPIEQLQTCPNCGQVVPRGHRFCGYCGQEVRGVTQKEIGGIHPEGDSEPQDFQEPIGSVPATSAGEGFLTIAGAQQHQLVRGLQKLMPATLTDKIRQAVTDLHGERREVTVLFVELLQNLEKSEDANSGEVDHETVYWVLDQTMRRLVEVIYKYEGTIDKFTGSGLMALFGAPVAHEDDPQRAIYAALDIHQTLEALSEGFINEYGFDLKARIGINTGEVVAGKLGNSLHTEYTVIGDTVNLASRLQNVAQPGTTLVSFSTYQRTRRIFHFVALPPLQVKGKPDPIRSYQVVSVLERPGRVRGLPGLNVPMVGRKNKLELLQKALDEVLRTGRSHYVLISGEAGLGKSRLVQEFLAQIYDQSINICLAACLAYTRSTPYYLLGALVRQLAQISEGMATDAQYARLESYLEELGLSPISEKMPYLSVTLGLEVPSIDEAKRMSGSTTEIIQRQVYQVLSQILRAEAALAPMVLVLEDTHWIDPASRAFFVEFFKSSSDLPILVIVVSREYERSNVIRPLVSTLAERSSRFTDILLDALNPVEALELVSSLLKQVGLYQEKLAHRIAQRAEGNPFYIEEVVRMLVEHEESEFKENTDAGDSNLAQSIQSEAVLNTVPVNLRGLILARFDALSDLSRQIMQRAAVLGRSFPVELLQRLTLLDIETLTRHLNDLVERQFLVRESFGSELGYAFRHILIQEAIYTTLLKRDRRELHYQVALVLEHESFLTRDEQAEALAHHYLRSNYPDRARPYLLQAAQRALQRSAYESAVQLLEQLLMFYVDEPAEFDPTYVEALACIGQALKFSGNYEGALEHLQAALAYLERYSLPELESFDGIDIYLEIQRELGDVLQRQGDFNTATLHLQGALEVAEQFDRLESPVGFTLIERKAWVDFRLGYLDRAADLAQEAIRRIERQESVGLPSIVLANLYNTLGGTAWQKGNLHEAISYVRGSLRIHEDAGYAWGMSVAYTNLGNLYWSMGQWAEATKAYARAAQIQADNGYIAEQTISLRNLGNLLVFQGKYEEARQAFLQTLTLCEAQENHYGLLLSHLALAALAVERGDRNELAYQLENARTYADLADLQHRLELAIYTGWLYIMDGRYAEAETVLLEARQEAEQAGLQEVLIDGEYALGILYGAQSRLSVAEYHFQRSAELAAQRGNIERQAKSLLELARIFLEQCQLPGQRTLALLDRAEALSHKAAELFQHLHISHRVVQCNQLNIAIERTRQQLSHLGRTSGQSALIGGVTGSLLPQGKRMALTVAWIELRTVSSVGPDDEWAFEELTTLISLARAIVEDLGGHMIRQANGALLVFGVPNVREDDPQQAVEAALRLLEELAKPSRVENVDAYEVAIGISTGTAFGQILEPGHYERMVVHGKPVDEAKKLANDAPANQIWIASTTAKHVRHAYVLTPAPQQNHLSESEITAFQVSHRLAEPRSARGWSQSVRMVGRRDLLRSMREFTQNIGKHRGGFLWVEGDAGIGKSRLLQEYVKHLKQAKITYWNGVCSARSTNRAFYLFAQIFATAFGFNPSDSVLSKRDKISRKLAALGLGDPSIQLYLELLCGLPPRAEDKERLQRVAPEQLRQQIFTAARALIAAQVSEEPLVLVIDDLHWVDLVSANLLLSLASLTLSFPVLFVIATRPGIEEDGPEEIRILRERFGAYSLFLDVTQLSPEESRDLLQALLGDEPVDPVLEQFVLKQSQGNPYFVGEFVRYLIEQGFVERTEHGWAMTKPPSEVLHTWPTSLEALIRSRLDVLPPLQHQLIQYAAVLARPFKAALMVRLLHQPQIEEILASLVRRRVLGYDSEGRHWYFGHHLTQMVIYNSLLRMHRQALHLDVAQALEEAAKDDLGIGVEELAHHYQEAGHLAKALDYWVQAGEQAMSRYAVEAALNHFEQAYEIIRTQILQVSPELRWRIAVGLSETYRYQGKLDQAAQILHQALDSLKDTKIEVAHKAALYRRLGDVVRRQGQPEKAYDAYRQALVLLEEPETQEGQAEAARALLGLAFTHFHRGHLDKAQRAAELGLEYAQKAESFIDQAGIENLLGGIAYEMGNWEQAMAHVNRAYQIQESENDLFGMAAALSNLAILAAEGGDRAQARTYFHRSLELRENIGDVEGVLVTHNNLGWLERLNGRFDMARFHFEQGRNISQSLRLPFHLATSLLGLGDSYLCEGEAQQAKELLEEAADWAQNADAKGLLAEIYRIRTQVALALGELDEAEEYIRWSILLAAETGSATLEGAAWRVFSQVQLARGAVAAAARSVEMAQQRLADVQGLEAGRLWVQSARVYMVQKKFEAARRELNRAKELFARLGVLPDLQEVENLLAECD